MPPAPPWSLLPSNDPQAEHMNVAIGAAIQGFLFSSETQRLVEIPMLSPDAKRKFWGECVTGHYVLRKG